jgi:hypothetical protein
LGSSGEPAQTIISVPLQTAATTRPAGPVVGAAASTHRSTVVHTSRTIERVSPHDHLRARPDRQVTRARGWKRLARSKSAAKLSVVGLYRPPVWNPPPPHTIISDPVQIVVLPPRSGTDTLDAHRVGQPAVRRRVHNGRRSWSVATRRDYRPVDHHAPRPDRSVLIPRGWDIATGRCRSPRIRRGVVPAAGTESSRTVATPDDHLGAGPAAVWAARAAGTLIPTGRRGPGIADGIVAPTGVQGRGWTRATRPKLSTPNDHLGPVQTAVMYGARGGNARAHGHLCHVSVRGVVTPPLFHALMAVGPAPPDDSSPCRS